MYNLTESRTVPPPAHWFAIADDVLLSVGFFQRLGPPPFPDVTASGFAMGPSPAQRWRKPRHLLLPQLDLRTCCYRLEADTAAIRFRANRPGRHRHRRPSTA
jgi:hypothetical protein